MPNLVLIKHSLPAVVRDQPASTWELSHEGRDLSRLLSERLKPYEMARIYASREPKASETGRLLADSLGIPCEVREGLHEHSREAEPFEESRDVFEAKVKALFEMPEACVFGDESASEALRRFELAIDAAMEERLSDNIAIVAHGTVISLLLQAKCGVDGFRLWTRLGLPAYVVVETPDWRIIEVIESIDGD